MVVLRLTLLIGGIILFVLSAMFANWRRNDEEVAWIVYGIQRGSAADIYRMWANGQDKVHIANINLDLNELQWSPDGGWIGYSANLEGSYHHIYRMRANGRHLERITPLDEDARYLVWSPDGRHIAYIAGEQHAATGLVGYWLKVVEVDGWRSKRLTNIYPQHQHVYWSPDSEWIYYEFDGDSRNLYRIGLDGGGGHSVVAFDGDESMVQLSPDGEWLVFFWSKTLNRELFRMRVDGSDLQQLTQDFGLEADPRWLPDGEWLAFSRRRNNDPRLLNVIRADGGEEQVIAENLAGVSDHQWSPDGEWISFIALEGDTRNLYRIRPDGTDLQQLTDAERHVETYAWSPMIDRVWTAWQMVLVGLAQLLMGLGLVFYRHKKLGAA